MQVFFYYSYIAIYIDVKCIFVFVDIGIHPIIDVRFCYFVLPDKNRLIFITDLSAIKSPVVDFVIDIIISLALAIFQVSSMLLLAILFSLKSRFDVNISLRTWFSFFRSSIWLSNDLIFLLCSVVFFSIRCNISSLGINVLRISLTYPYHIILQIIFVKSFKNIILNIDVVINKICLGPGFHFWCFIEVLFSRGSYRVSRWLW